MNMLKFSSQQYCRQDSVSSFTALKVSAGGLTRMVAISIDRFLETQRDIKDVSGILPNIAESACDGGWWYVEARA